MSPSAKGGALSFSIGMAAAAHMTPRSPDTPLQVLVLADCSGRAARGLHEPLAARRPRPVDIERLEQAWRAWGAELPLSLPSGTAITLRPRDLEELHPEQLLQNVPELAEILELRDALEREPGAAERLTSRLSHAPKPPGPSSASAASAERAVASATTSGAESGEDTLSRLLGGPSPAAGAERPAPAIPPRGGVDLSRFIRSVVGAAPKTAPGADVSALRSAAELELHRALSAILSDPGFRSLEAAWRGIDGLCRNCPDEERIRYSVLDASWAELAADLPALATLLESQRPDILLVDHRVAASPEELEGLAQLLSICASHDVTLVAGARPLLAGCAHFAELADPTDDEQPLSEAAREAWAKVTRARSAGARLGLALPRYLLRQPYGKAGEPIEPLAFEELLDQNDHEAFSWGNGAYLLVRALGVVHAGASGVHPDGSVDLRELPVVHLEGDAGIRIKPCAEAWLSERAVGRLRAAGFSVLQGLRDTDRVRVHV